MGFYGIEIKDPREHHFTFAVTLGTRVVKFL